MDTSESKTEPLSEEGKQNLIAYYEKVRQILSRLLAEGYIMRNGELITLSSKDDHQKYSTKNTTEVD